VTDHLDLYLLHWPGSVPLAETVAAMEALREAGKIGAWGVSNFDTDRMDALLAAGGGACATNQVLYNVTRRGPEFDLLPWLAERRMPMMAYSPVEQGRLPQGGALAAVAEGLGVTPYQVALAWVLRQGAIAIPKAADIAHVRQNRAAADLDLSHEDIAVIDEAFAPPSRKQRLEML
jgi:diketogulonate reductase-like aldo/keto reductase